MGTPAEGPSQRGGGGRGSAVHGGVASLTRSVVTQASPGSFSVLLMTRTI